MRGNRSLQQETVVNDKQRSKKIRLFHETPDRPTSHQGIGPYDVGVSGCWFYRLPHKMGADHVVGKPMSNDYLNKIEDGTIQATSSSLAKHVLELNQRIKYWSSARGRILSQMVVWLDQSQLPPHVSKRENFDSADGSYGAILPLVVTTGTLGRKPVESTWMNSLNPQTVT